MQQLKWQTVQRLPSELIPYEHNPRFLTPEQKQQIAESLEKFGLVEIPAIDTENRIIAGHQRVRLLIESGKGDEPIDVRIPNRPLTDEEYREYLIRSNANTGSWDVDVLAEHFEVDDLADWGLDVSELDMPIKKKKPEEASPIPELQESPIKRGDIFQLGPHRIICGDSSNMNDVAQLLEGYKFELVFTSPPYNMASDLYKHYDDNKGSDEYIAFNIKVVEALLPYLKGFIFWNISYNRNARSEFIDIAYKLKQVPSLRFLELIVWNKKSAMPITSPTMLTRQYEDIFVLGTEEAMIDMEVFWCGTNQRKAHFHKSTKQTLSNYWELPTIGSQIETHNACYPVALHKKGIELMTLPKQKVFDPFLGSGTTLIAAEQSDRICFGVEYSPEYCSVIIRRYANYCQQQKMTVDFIHLNGNLKIEDICKQ
jgi:DNA modification methylase